MATAVRGVTPREHLSTRPGRGKGERPTESATAASSGWWSESTSPSLVLEHGGQRDDVCAAVLHDTAEDQGGKETLAREQRAGVTELTRVVGWAGPLHPLAQRGLSDLV